MNKLIVISGCSGGGKSTLLDMLKQNNYAVMPEIGRLLIKEQVASNGDAIPWINAQSFSEKVIEKSIAAYHQASSITNAMHNIIFFDRCFLDNVSYYQTLAIETAHQYDHLIDDLRFDKLVFMVPPWREIFCQDEERQRSFDNAVAEYERLLRFYKQFVYQILEIPKMPIKERCEFVLKMVDA